MSVPTTAINESSPAGSDNISSGDNEIRTHKVQVREILSIDHEYPNTGQSASAGQHKQVTLQEQANLGTGAVGTTILGSQTIGGKGELVYTDEDDNDVQLTSGGAIYALGILAKVYPVGSIYINATVATNPATLLGFGTWTAFGAGKVMIGLDAGDGDFDTVEETGGSKTVSVAHTHDVRATNTSIWGAVGTNTNNTLALGKSTSSDSKADSATSDGATSAMSANATPSIVQEYIVCYFWKRTV